MKKNDWRAVNGVPGVDGVKSGVAVWNFQDFSKFGMAPQLFYAYESGGSFYAERIPIVPKETVRELNPRLTHRPISDDPTLVRLQRWLKKVISDGMLDTKYSIQQPIPKQRKAAKSTFAPAKASVVHPDRAVAEAMGGVYVISQFDGSWTKNSAYTFEQIVSIINDAIGTTFRLWGGWAARGLVVVPMKHDRTMGEASPLRDGVRMLRLNERLFSEYNADAIRRTVLHELAHHKRFDEGFTRADHDGHDARFCELLGMVDEVVRAAPMEQCRYFTDDVDHSMIAARTKSASPDGVVVVFEQTIKFSKSGVRTGSAYSLKVKPKKGRAFTPVVYSIDAKSIEAIIDAYGGDADKIEGSSTVNGKRVDIVNTFSDVVREIVYVMRTHAIAVSSAKIKEIADRLSGGEFDIYSYEYDRNVDALSAQLRSRITSHGDVVEMEAVDGRSLIEPGTSVLGHDDDYPLLRLKFDDGESLGWFAAKPTMIGALASVLGEDIVRMPFERVMWERSYRRTIDKDSSARDHFIDLLDMYKSQKQARMDFRSDALLPPIYLIKTRKLLDAAASGGTSQWH